MSYMRNYRLVKGCLLLCCSCTPWKHVQWKGSVSSTLVSVVVATKVFDVYIISTHAMPTHSALLCSWGHPYCVCMYNVCMTFLYITDWLYVLMQRRFLAAFGEIQDISYESELMSRGKVILDFRNNMPVCNMYGIIIRTPWP